MLTPEQQAERTALFTRNFNEPKFYVESYLKIRNLARQIVPLKLNVPQQKVWAAIEKQRAEGKPVRIIVLKARREGVSTLSEALLFHHAATHPGVVALVIAHTLNSCSEIFDMAKLFYARLPKAVKPMSRYSNRKELVFDTPDGSEGGLGSSMQMGTAGTTDIGRAPRYDDLHVSELAFCPNAADLMLGLMQAIPNLPDTMVIEESTANGRSGVGKFFYDEWQRAAPLPDGTTKSGFVRVFLSCFDDPKNQMDVPEGFAATEEEVMMKAAYGINDRQLSWRRWCIDKDCLGDTEKFKQEYPSNADEAFLLSGRPVFDNATLDRYYAIAAQVEPIKGECVSAPNIADVRAVAFNPNSAGLMSVWRPPDPSRQYVLGVDASAGCAGGDNAVIAVLDRINLSHVATIRGLIPPDILAWVAYRVAKYYNFAGIAVETAPSGHGMVTQSKLIDILGDDDAPIELYQRKSFDNITGQWVNKWGWATNVATRKQLIDGLVAALRDSLLETYDVELLNECRAMQYDDREIAISDEHDDTVFALGIALQAHQTMTLIPDISKRAELPPIQRLLARVVEKSVRRSIDRELTDEEMDAELNAEEGIEEDSWM